MSVSGNNGMNPAAPYAPTPFGMAPAPVQGVPDPLVAVPMTSFLGDGESFVVGGLQQQQTHTQPPVAKRARTASVHAPQQTAASVGPQIAATGGITLNLNNMAAMDHSIAPISRPRAASVASTSAKPAKKAAAKRKAPAKKAAALAAATTNTAALLSAYKTNTTTAVSDKASSVDDDDEEDRKQRNRQHAKKAREKKKNLMQTLQSDLQALQDENDALRNLVKKELPREAAAIISQDCYRSTDLIPNYMMPQAAVGSSCNNSTNGRPAVFGTSDFELLESLTQEQQSFVLTDPRLPDNPIVYASPAFTELTGYQRDQVIGRNCRFLQGPTTDEKAVETIREGLKSGRDVTVRLLNFKADGTPFWNQFFLAALHDKDRRVVNYVGVQCMDAQQDEEDHKEGEDDDEDAEPTEVSSTPAQIDTSKLQAQSEANRQWAVVGAPHVVGGSHMSQSLPPALLHQNHFGVNTSIADPLAVDGGGNDIDWADLAKVMEADFNDDMGMGSFLGEDTKDDMLLAPYQEDDDEDDDNDDLLDDDGNFNFNWSGHVDGENKSESKPLAATSTIPTASLPMIVQDKNATAARTFVLQTLKSELIHALLDSQGDVKNLRFDMSLDVLAKMYRSQQDMSQKNDSYSPLLHGNWRSLSQPNYNGCLGTNENDECVYTLGKMSFNMFQPGNVRCIVQRTITAIAPVCEMDKAPRSAPFGLRRELAHQASLESSQAYPHTMLKSYE